MKKLNKGANDSGVVLDDEAEYKRQARAYNRRCYRNTILRSVITFFSGVILMAFLEAFGLGCFLFGFLLFLFGIFFAFTLKN